MGNCELVNQLNRLRKSSSDSIDAISRFDDFKKYMHVSRRVEQDLIDILNKVNSGEKKTLVLLCGSAGDGKSHLLSFLKNEEKLLDNYIVYNDATESSSPSKTAIDTLAEALQDFTDENVDLPGKNFILAINLGVLSNFIESKYGNSFKKLHEYVITSNILTNQLNVKKYDANSLFQHVSFSDYHMYTLTEKGAVSDYLEQILEKVFSMHVNNPFYCVYEKYCRSCPISERCPVKHNFEFLMEEKIQKFIAYTLVEVVVKDKEILTTREIFNYIYDIVVPQKFNPTKIAQASTNMDLFLKEYIKGITPVLIYEYNDMSALLNHVKQYDPLLNRSEEADETAIFYYVSSDIENEIVKVMTGISYGKVFCQKSSIDRINDDKVLKAQLYNIIVRINAMLHERNDTNVFSSFLKNLYYYNAGKIKKFGELYNLVEEAIFQWCGGEARDNICYSDLRNGVALYERIEFEPHLKNIPEDKKVEELQRFLPFITIEYENKESIISLDIDYSLYELIYKLASGYIQTADDRNNHADFISFIRKMIKTGSADKELTLITEDNRRAIIEKTKFGVYKFKVVK